MKRAEKKKLTFTTRRRELVVATLESIRKHGYMNATIKTISEESGLSRGLISHYFVNKDDLLLFAYQYLGQHVDDLHRHVVRSSEGGHFEKLLAGAYVPFLQNQPYAEVWVHFWSASRMLPQVKIMHQELWARYRRSVERRITAVARERGQELDIMEVTLMYTQLIDGLWVGLFMEEAYDAETCRRLLRNWLCGVFNEPLEKHPVSPVIDMDSFTTEAPI